MYKELIEAVTAEATAIKEHATPKEIANLDFETMDADNALNCIYGQMTGDCANRRATELLSKCAIKSIDESDSTKLHKYTEDDYGRITSRYRMYNFKSALEHYIMLEDANNENLIDFISGDTDKLEL